MIEQIARAIIDDLVRVTPLSGSSMTYNAETGCVDFEGAFRPAEIAQSIVPLIEAAVMAERERCAGVAEQPIFFDYVRLTTPDGPFEPGSPYDRGRQVEAERIAKAIRSQP